MSKYTQMGIFVAGDIVCINIAYIIAFLLRFEFSIDIVLKSGFFTIYLDNLVWIVLIKVAIIAAFGLYNSLWKYAGTEQILKVFAAATLSLLAVMLFLTLTQQVIPRGVQCICYLIDILLMGGTRLGYRVLFNPSETGGLYAILRSNMSSGKSKSSRVLLVGAGDAGASMIKEMTRNPETGKHVVAVIDDDVQKAGKRIAGKKIIGSQDMIVKAAGKYEIDEIIVAIPSATRKQIQSILNECNKTDCKIQILPAYIDLIDGKVNITKLRNVAIEDLLGREPVSVNLDAISGYISGKVVLVTGGGGSIGSELCRQIAAFHPQKLIALDIYENSVFDLSNEMRMNRPEVSFKTVITSIRNRRRLADIFEEEHPQVVFHAAAHKHVPLMELNPKEAVLNNIIGTKNIIELSDLYRVERFVLISTDKAVNPTNVMGATKRVAEMLMQYMSSRSLTNFSAVRFGNVLGSNGSVLPLFRSQIEQGGPVTVTNDEVTRYFMTISEAVQLVIQSGAMAAGGEIFILDMGDPIRIMDLAENVIRLSGYVPYIDIDIVVIGLRPGEKLYEELLLAEEGIRKTTHRSIYVGHPLPPSPVLSDLLTRKETDLEKMAENICCLADIDVKEWLSELVPNYSVDKTCSNRGTPAEKGV